MDLAQHHDRMQGPVQLPIPTTVAAMADDLTRGRLHRGRPGWDQLISSWAALMGPIPG
jgi:hypothetical protein